MPVQDLKRAHASRWAKPALFAAGLATGLLARAWGLGLAAMAGGVALGLAAASVLWRRTAGTGPAARDPLFERRYLRSVIDGIPHFIFARDRSGRFTLVNRSVAAFYGRPVEEIEGRHVLDIHPDREQARLWLEEDRATLARGEMWSLPVIETTQANGESIWIAAIKKPLPTEAGGEPQVLGVSIDISEQVRAERAMVAAREAAEASNRAKSAFLANMSHEIRTPMNSVIGIADLLSEMHPTPRQRRYLEMISVSGSTLLSLINDILDLSKIEAGQLELDPVATDLHELADEVTGLIAFAAQRSGLELICRLAPGVPRLVLVDPGRLRQVLTNLLNNAVKFTQRGHVYLNIEPVGVREAAVDLRFEIIDTGIGIPADARDRIFEKFTQAEAGTTRRFGGTGLGLAISRQLVETMGGAIDVRSAPGEGSTFSFTLPVPVLAEAAAPAVATDPANVLVVTRLGLRGEVLREQLQQFGHAARVIAGGPEALDQDGGPTPTHVLYDQAADGEPLPDLRPWQRRFPPGQAPRTVLLSPLTSHEFDDSLAGHGFDETLPKPVTSARLIALLAGEKSPLSPAVAPALPDSAPALADDDDDDDGAATAGGPRVLLAEDNPFNQKVAIAMLRLLGCRVELAATGVEAVALARDGGFDLVLMDCQMPTMDGYEATRRIRGLPGPAAAVPIIAMTANALSDDRKACFAYGMDDFLAKPVTKSMLSEMIRKWMAARAGATAEPAPL
jgi:two-component system, sensor histidine kinase and response regulator